MKTFWKILGITALAAAVPVRFKKDEETGKKTYQSLLISVDVNTDQTTGKVADVGINIGDGLLSNAVMSAVKKKETVHFADDEPEAAVIPDVIDFAQAAKAQEEAAPDGGSGCAPAQDGEPAPAAEVTEADFDPET